MARTRTSNRGAYRRRECVFIGAWFPRALVEAMDLEVQALDMDRSKIIRRAVAEKLKKALQPQDQSANPTESLSFVHS